MQGKNSFMLYCDIIHSVEKLPDEKAGYLFKHILRYVNDKEPVTDDIIVELCFEPIKQALKRDLEKWKIVCERNKNNGSKGGRNKTQSTPDEPSGFQSTPDEPDKDKDKDKDKYIDSLKSKFSNQIKQLYPTMTDFEKEELNKFYNYWTEPNKSKTKIKWQMEKTWDLQRRINTWFDNAEKFRKK